MALDNKNQYIQGLDEYIRQGEPQKQERGRAWQTTIWLKEVNALVRANYSNLQEGVTETTVFLERFFRNMLLGETSPLRNREMHLDWKQETESRSSGNTSKSAKPAIQSANSAQELPPKCNFCTLEEVAVLRVIQQNPSATQKYIAFEIGKSERTVKSTTARLAEQGFLKRVNGKRNGYWEIVNGK